MLTDTLVNPTPFEVEIPYSAATSLIIPADGSIKLNMQQLDDFRGDKAGSEEPRKLLDQAGVFLLDGDLSYDVQALQAIKKAIQVKGRFVSDFISRFKDNRIKAGHNATDADVEVGIEMAGYDKIQAQIEALKKRAAILEAEVAGSSGKLRQTLDPERTCFVTEPPRQFASKTALKMFLEENPDIKAKHEALSNVETENDG
jgi:hypothetical protein